MMKVLFFAPFGSWTVHHQLDAVLAAALRVRGCEVAAVGCDGIFSTCDVLAWSGESAAKVCQQCTVQSRRLFGQLDLPLFQMRDYLTPHDFERANEWSLCLDVADYATATFEGVPIGKWATSSVFSHFRITSASLHLPEVRRVHRGYLVTALLAWMSMTRILDGFCADAMVVFNGRMAPYRVAYEMARARGLRVLGHERGVAPGSFTLYENASCCEPQSVFEHIRHWRQVPLSAADLERCLAVTRRHTGAHMNYPGFYDYRTEADGVRGALGIPQDARVLGVFTSSEFELANQESYSSVTSQLEYIDRLIEVFRGSRDHLVVRHHPNISTDPVAAPDLDFVRRAWLQAQSAPANVHVIMPSEKLSSYGLIPHLSGAIAFYSSTCVEAIARGVAAAALAESYVHMSATFLIQDTSREAFARLVNDLFARTESFQPSDLRSAYRHLAASLPRHSSKFAAFEMKNFFEADIRIQHDRELLPGSDEVLDRACDFLMTGAHLFSRPTAEDLQRSTQEEDAFFAAEWERLSQLKTTAPSPGVLDVQGSVASLPVAVVQIGDGTDVETSRWYQRSRHRALVPHGNVAVKGLSWGQVRDELIARLDGMSERHVMLVGGSFEYDESFISSSVRLLAEEEALGGVTCGAWLARPGGQIEGEIFTTRNPCADFYEACGVLPSFHHPWFILSFGLFRVACLLEVLRSVPREVSREEAALQLFGLLHGVAFRHLPLPMLMMRARAGEQEAAGPREPLDTPVLFLVFNRPDLTQQVFERIREQRPRRLFIAADGPRSHLPAEKVRCDVTRRFVLDGIDWECEVKTLFRDGNLGCRNAVSSAITWFFEHVEEGIILEDDCLPERDFFRFCSFLLERYRHNSEVMHIGGVNFQQGRWRGEGSWYFSKYPHIWGWATWRRAWNHYDVHAAGLDDFLASQAWRNLCSEPAEAALWEPLFHSVRDGTLDTWDFQWTYAVWKNNGCAALPQVNLVTNLGFRADATHTSGADARLANLKTLPLGELEAPAVVVRDEAADVFTCRNVFSPGPAPGKNGRSKKEDSSAKLAGRLKRITGEMEAIKESLTWKLAGKPLHSIEKRIARLFDSRR